MKILLIEDNELISTLYKRQLEKAGFSVTVADTGNASFSFLLTQTYDFIMLDMILPDMNGLAILRHIKQDEKTSSVPVLVLSNSEQDPTVKEAKELGAVGFLIKDQYSPDQIVEKVKTFISPA